MPDWEDSKSTLRAAGEDVSGTHADIARNPAAVKLVQKDVTAITAHLADYECVRRIALLPEEFSIEKGEMTPTLKVKRAVIEQKYGGLIDDLYRGA